MTRMEAVTWGIITMIIIYTTFAITQLIIYLTTPRRESPKSFAYWWAGFWFDKKMRLRKKFGILGLHLLGCCLIIVIYYFIRVMID